MLTEIDVKTTLKEKINVDFRRDVILGACNPTLAHRALSANTDVGLLLPCNVTVQKTGNEIAITAVDPLQMLGVLQEDPAVNRLPPKRRQNWKGLFQASNNSVIPTTHCAKSPHISFVWTICAARCVHRKVASYKLRKIFDFRN